MIKTLKVFTIFAAAAIFFLPSGVFSHDGEDHTEKIEIFDATIDINRDSTLTVEEKIVFDFGENERHGIIRHIPLKYDFGSIDISNIEVTDADGKKIAFKTYKTGGDQVVQVGSEKSFVSNVQTYVISYTVKGAINHLEDHNEVYWNVTGDQWPVPITQAEATVRLPQPLSEELLQTQCYVGPRGNQDACRQVNFFATSNSSGYTFAQNNLEPGEGLTVALGFPKNYIIAENSSFISSILKFLGIVFLVTIFWLVFKRRKNKKTEYPKDRPSGLDNGHSGGGVGGGGGRSW